MSYRFFYFFIFLGLILKNAFAVPSNRLIPESEFNRFLDQRKESFLRDDPALLKPVNQYFFYFGLDNDNYYRLDKKKTVGKTGNDFGQTHALTLGGILREPIKGKEFGINFETALFTRYLGYTDSEPPMAVQSFREITTLDFTLTLPQKKQNYFRYLFGVGLLNDSHSIPLLALWQQSGNDGSGGVHRLMGLNTRLKDEPSGGRTGFLTGGWSVGKFVTLQQYLNWPKHLSWMNFTFESGFLARTVTKANTVFGLIKWNIPLVRSDFVVRGKGFIDFNIQGKSNYYLYENAVGYSFTYGLQMNFSKGGVMLSYTYNYANQNPSFYKYTDADSLINLMTFYSF